VRLEFAQIGENCVLKEEYGTDVFSWQDRKETIDRWFNGLLDSTRAGLFTEFMEKAHEYLSASSISSEWKITIADWLVDWGYSKNLSPRFKRAHYELVRSLFFWSLGSCEAGDYELNYKARLYLKIVFDKDNSFSQLTSRDRENEIKDVLYKDPKEAQILRAFLTVEEDKYKEYRLRILKHSAEWFLRRYDLATAGNLFKAVNSLSRQSKKTKLKWFRRLSFAVKSLASNRFLATRVIMLVAMLVLFIFPTVGLDINWMMAILLACLYLPIPWMMYHIVKHEEPWHFKLILPRMMGAIVVGYLAIVTAEETWKVGYHMYANWKAFLIVTGGLGLLASFMYLFVEIGNINTKRRTFHRTMAVWVIGLMETTGVGLILCHLVSRYFSPESLGLTDVRIDPVKLPICGEMYPQVLFLFAPLALFVGIFVQILWEDKPISEPL